MPIKVGGRYGRPNSLSFNQKCAVEIALDRRKEDVLNRPKAHSGKNVAVTDGGLSQKAESRVGYLAKRRLASQSRSNWQRTIEKSQNDTAINFF